ncbi:hypothetical protein [Providencia sp. PROV172]|uniref:hypothetical protein n=1 Tax=Providencia sp. PROV172 TaxID=2949876 RepID=UPI00234B7379|nr:hypothetical protein [Providencia sp. PROV172]
MIKCLKSGYATQSQQVEALTLRDQFAMAAMQGDWAAQDECSGYFDENSGEATFSKSAEMYYRMADAMLAARGK